MDEEYKITLKSGKGLVRKPVPDIPYRVQGMLRANGGRLSLTGQYKSEKSLLAHDLAFRVAAGDDWLGFKTMQGKVLYANLEISEEKFHERTQDIQSVLELDEQALSNFKEFTLTDRTLALDASMDEMQQILGHCEKTKYKVDMLILDPRARLIKGSV